MKLIIGNKNYSSWSFRPWIAMKVADIPFEEEVISLDAAEFKARVGKISGTGKVPALVDGDVHVWESLAILEYLAEKFPRPGCGRANRRRGPRPRRSLPRCMRASSRCAATADEHVAAGAARASSPPEVQAEHRPHRGHVDRLPHALRQRGGRSCSVPSAPPMPCTRRWCRASIPMGSRSARWPEPTWRR